MEPIAGKIFEAIPKVMADIDAIGKNRRNSQGSGYNFRGIDDVYNEVHVSLAKHGVFTVPAVLEERTEERPSKSGGLLIYRVLKIKYDFFAVDGSSVSAVVIGEGMDSGDKASNKAMSVAHKYCLLQVFAIPTEDLKDPENDTPEVAHTAPRPAPRAAPRPPPATPRPLPPKAPSGEVLDAELYQGLKPQAELLVRYLGDIGIKFSTPEEKEFVGKVSRSLRGTPMAELRQKAEVTVISFSEEKGKQHGA